MAYDRNTIAKGIGIQLAYDWNTIVTDYENYKFEIAEFQKSQKDSMGVWAEDGDSGGEWKREKQYAGSDIHAGNGKKFPGG